MYAFSAFAPVMFALSLVAPPPGSVKGFAAFALVAQLMVIGLVPWLDQKKAAERPAVAS